jgi:hypothetical protein
MALLGQAALAMFWNIAPEMRREFEDWHSHEHFRERLSIPGFRRASRWTSATGGEGCFQLYELERYETLSSPAYLERLNAPTPWSRRMMPHHRDMTRCQCHVLESAGGIHARHLLAIRLSPADGRADQLRGALRSLAAVLIDRPGFTGTHLLRHEAPAIATTAEQKIRGGDRSADWILLVNGYDLREVEAIAAGELSPMTLTQIGAQSDSVSGIYTLSYAALPTDVV